jgi:8-oxo-dGTP pyrophosphatase MutT (NUDIX family)
MKWGEYVEPNYTAARAQLQALLGKYLRTRVTCPIGAPFAGKSGVVSGTNYGEVFGFSPVGAKPDGVFVLGIHHPVRYFEGRVIALIFTRECKTYAVCAPKKSRYIVGQICRALRFALEPGSYKIQCLYERSCGAVVFHRTEEGLRFLLIKNRRSANWGYPKGHVENHETAEETARREVLEETGLHIRLIPGFSCQSEYVMQGSIEKNVTIFLAEAAPDVRTVIQEEEIEDFMWADYQKALQTLKFENDRATLRRAHAFLRRQSEKKKPGIR